MHISSFDIFNIFYLEEFQYMYLLLSTVCVGLPIILIAFLICTPKEQDDYSKKYFPQRESQGIESQGKLQKQKPLFKNPIFTYYTSIYFNIILLKIILTSIFILALYTKNLYFNLSILLVILLCFFEVGLVFILKKINYSKKVILLYLCHFLSIAILFFIILNVQSPNHISQFYALLLANKYLFLQSFFLSYIISSLFVLLILSSHTLRNFQKFLTDKTFYIIAIIGLLSSLSYLVIQLLSEQLAFRQLTFSDTISIFLFLMSFVTFAFVYVSFIKNKISHRHLIYYINIIIFPIFMYLTYTYYRNSHFVKIENTNKQPSNNINIENINIEVLINGSYIFLSLLLLVRLTLLAEKILLKNKI